MWGVWKVRWMVPENNVWQLFCDRFLKRPLLPVSRNFMNVAKRVLWRMAIILKTNKVNLFVSSGLFVYWYHSPNILDTPHIYNISWLRVKLRIGLVISARLSVCMYKHSYHWTHFPDIWYFCRGTANSVKIWQNCRSHEFPSVFHIVDSDIFRASMATLLEFIVVENDIFKSTTLRDHGNNGYVNAPQCNAIVSHRMV
jgi:hypothetical protein